MPLNRSLLMLPAVAVVAAAITTSCGPSERAAVLPPREPSSCDLALAAATARDQAERDIARLQEQARRGVDVESALEQLGYRFIARARATADEGNYFLAEQSAACLLERRPDHASALLLRGHVLHQMHRFDEAERIARRLVSVREFVLDYGLLGDVLMERGRLSEAAAAYQKMIDLKPFFQSYTRAAHLRWMRGDLDGAIELIRMAIGAASPRDPESIAWAYGRLAFYELQAGRLSSAQRAVDAALDHQPGYGDALLTKARLLLATKRDAEAVTVLEGAARTHGLPEYQWALADALRLLGRAAEADTVEQELVGRGARTDPRTLALFLATRRTSVEDATALARRELDARADVFTLDALAWSLAAAGRFAEARPLMARALAEGTHDGRLFVHAAVIASGAGRPDEARRWAEKAVRLRNMLHPSELDELENVRSALSSEEN